MHDIIEHRMDTPERKHYTIEGKSFVDINPTLLYCGTLGKLQDWKDSKHQHTFLEIIYILDGKGIVEIGEKQYPVTSGDIVVYNAATAHFEESSTETPMEARFVAFDNLQLKDLPVNCIVPPNGECIFKAEKYSDTIVSLFDIIKNEISSKNEFYIEIAKNASRTLLMYFFRIINQTLNNAAFLNKGNALNGVLPYIDKNFLNDISLEDIAEKCFVSKYYLSHLFTETLGMSVGQYIKNKKIELAKTYLSENIRSIEDIAARCGFNDINYFGRAFKKATSMTPSNYRKAFAAKQTHE
ncbi:MAG: AraC family transcriptional regulator [Oscillospiraceae bacterium]